MKRNIMKGYLLIGSLLFLLVVPHPAEAAKRWFGTGAAAANCAQITGESDPGAYLSWTATWACMQAGDTFHMKAGSYSERMHDSLITVPNGSSAGAPTIIEGEGAAGCAVAENCNTVLTRGRHNFEVPQHLIFRNFSIDGTADSSVNDPCLSLRSAPDGWNANIVMENVEIHHCGSHGVIDSSHMNNTRFTGISIHHTGLYSTSPVDGQHAFYLQGDDIILENCVAHDTGTSTMHFIGQFFDSAQLGTIARPIIRNCLFYNSRMTLWVAAYDYQIYNNIFMNVTQDSALLLATGPSIIGCVGSGLVANNLFYNNGWGIWLGNATGCSPSVNLSNNIIIGNGVPLDSSTLNLWNRTGSKNAGNCGTTCGASPVSISTVEQCTVNSTNFHQKADPNPCVNAGATVSAVTTDKDGVLRPQGSAYDIGPYERVGDPPLATFYWASPGGNNSASCTAIDSDSAATDPGSYGTINRAANCATMAGDTVIIKPGNYTGTNHRIKTDTDCLGDCLKSGTSEEVRTTIMGQPGQARPVIQMPTFIGIYDETAESTRQYITIRDLIVDSQNAVNTDGHQMAIEGAYITVENVEMYGAWNDQIVAHINNSYVEGLIHHLVIRNNKLHGQAGDGNGYCLYIEAPDSLMEHNECYNKRGGGFKLWGRRNTSSSRMTARYNYIHDIVLPTAQETGCFGIAQDGGTSLFYGNIITTTVDCHTGYDGGYWPPDANNNIIMKNLIAGFGTSIRLDGAGATSGHLVSNNHIPGGSISGTGTFQTNRTTAITGCVTSLANPTPIAGSVCINQGTASLFPSNGLPDQGPYEAFLFSSASMNANTMDVTLLMNVPETLPVIPGTGMTGFSVGCTGDDCGSPVVTSAARLAGSDSVVRLTIGDIGGSGSCAAGQTWTVTYTPGNVTDSALIGNVATLVQPLSAFTTQPVTAVCSGTPPPPPAGPHITYNMNEGTGTTLQDGTANDIDGTHSAGIWGTGKTGTGIAFNDNSAQKVTFNYGSGENPITTSHTVIFAVNVPANLTDAQRVYFGSTVGSSQRFYISTFEGTWRIGVQGSSDSVASDLSVQQGWNRVCVTWDKDTPGSGTGTATLHVNGTASNAAGGKKTYTSYTLASNAMIGSPFNGDSPGVVYDDFALYRSAVSCADDYAAWEQSSPPPSGTITIAGGRFMYPRKNQSGDTEYLTPLNAEHAVRPGGYFAVDFQINGTAADPEPFGVRLLDQVGGSGSFVAVPDGFTATGLAFYGNTLDTNIVSGTTDYRLTGALDIVNGSTQFTAAAVPVVDLDVDTSVVLRYVLRIAKTAVPDTRHCLKLVNQSGAVFDAYTPSDGLCFTVSQSTTAGF